MWFLVTAPSWLSYLICALREMGGLEENADISEVGHPDQIRAPLWICEHTLLLLRHPEVIVAFRVTVDAMLAHGETANEASFFRCVFVCFILFFNVCCCYVISSQTYSFYMFNPGVEVYFHPLKYCSGRFHLFFWAIRRLLDLVCVSSFFIFCHLGICWFWNIMGPDALIQS